ncbi:hypothetical protein V2G26_006195 [Clonostachys chloroleuca]
MQNYTEDALQRAILANKEGLGLRKAVKLWGIPLTTLKQETELAGWGSHQVRKIIRDFIDDKVIDPPMRLLFRKIYKGLDEQQVKISLNTVKIAQLERQNEMLRPKKRTRLLPNPNSKFSTVEQLAKQAARYDAIPDEIEAPEELENYIFEELCFQWQIE